MKNSKNKKARKVRETKYIRMTQEEFVLLIEEKLKIGFSAGKQAVVGEIRRLLGLD